MAGRHPVILREAFEVELTPPHDLMAPIVGIRHPEAAPLDELVDGTGKEHLTVSETDDRLIGAEQVDVRHATPF
jgi:hypothetical protein